MPERSDGTSFTWKAYASKIFTVITLRQRHASEIVLVNDRYDLPFTIKDSERNLRSGNSPGPKNVFIRAADKFPSPRAFQEFLRNPANKERLQKFLQTEFNVLCRVYPNTNGCDTTAAFFARNKTTIYDKAFASEDARVILRSVGKSLPVPQVVLDEMAMFTIKFIYNDNHSQTLGDASARKWTEMKKRKSTLRLPPDRNSHDLKIKRVNYQTFMMLNFDKADPPPSPINHGWTLDNGMCIPVRYTQPALPRYLSEVRQHHLQIGADTGLGESDSGGDSDSDDDDDNGYE
ncbi:hypothetical protein Pmani_007021 [Petrolisthes manimaculis]|uniref:Uncharacterized protein n=1 Tax=Petrolisthes manimaculis TaxID=1843537 RepID=A0AAE1Q979_9EUCA|nr:hypothetical protein Pmani_007021 [Petrolisthes manimaculis]